ncbi:ATP-binding protein [Paenibacillus sp.]|uniref:ATP-binding protein n=1 Tax=Paenibacillus sp. TaxID=58172 RepID=UPI002D32BA99|nr:ATP-binding protein [Paenibacillus sp.]HZG85020.1 ATP-binding protein [Paenibacillus sp.]
MSIVEDGRFLVVSRDMLQLLGYGEDDLTGERFDRVFRMNAADRIDESRPFRARAKAACANGAGLPVTMHITATTSGAKRYWLIRSIERAEPEARSDVAERYRAAFEQSGIAAALLGPDGAVRESNQAFRCLLGLRDQEEPQTNLAAMLPIEDAYTFRQGCARLAAGRTGAFEMEGRLSHASGRSLRLQLRVAAVSDRAGRPDRFIVQLQDVASRREAEERLRRAEQRKMAARLAAGVAHEIRNPLTVVKGAAQMMRETDKDNFMLGLLLSEVERIETVVDDFLRIGEDEPLRLLKADLNALAADAAKGLESFARHSGVRIETRFPSERCMIWCDAVMLKQALGNLIQNAIEAMEGGGRLQLALERNPDRTVSLIVRDEGCGMSPERLARLGEPYFSSKEKGAGFGLMFSYRIIERHGGSVQVTSRIHAGTTFVVSLPLSVLPASASAHAAPAPASSPALAGAAAYS